MASDEEQTHPDAAQAAATPPATTPTTTRAKLSYLDKPLTRNWAKGARLEYLVDHLDEYIENADRGRDACRATLDRIVNDYFKKFDWRLPLTDDPDPTSPPNRDETLSAADNDTKGLVVSKMRTAITNWLQYRANKITTPYKHLKNLSNTDPYAVLLSRLTGIGLRAPNRTKGWQEFQRCKFADYKAAFDAKVEQDRVQPSRIATTRNKFMQTIFDKFPDETKALWEKKAQERHAEEVSAREARIQRLDALTPQERQDAIRRLADFFLPIIEGASSVLNMHVSVFVGGPEPASGGALNVLSIHSGVNQAAIPMTWGEADPDTFKDVTSNFMNYLETCYTSEDKANAALPRTSETTTREDLGEDESDTPRDSRPSRAKRPSSNRAARRESDDEDDSNDPRPRRRSRAKRPSSTRRHRSRRQERDEEEDDDEDDRPRLPHRSRDKHPQSPRRRPRGSRRQESDEYTSHDDRSSEEDSDDEHSRDRRRRQAHKRQHSPTTPKKTRRSSKNKADGRPPPKKPCLANDQASSSDNNDSPPSTPTASNQPPVEEPPVVVPTFACPVPPGSNLWPAHLNAPPVSSLWERWFASNYAPLLEIEKMDPDWQTVLATYVMLEETTGFQNPGAQVTLPSDYRPDALQWWISRGRDTTRRQQVTISNLDNFDEAWWKWWKFMQPEWRNVGEVEGCLTEDHRAFDLAISEGPDSWPTLDKHGANGFLSVVASLGWWGRHLSNLYPRWNSWILVDPHGRSWHKAAIDTIWVMQRLTAARRNRSAQ
ncbi:hypothetical protein ONZ45_g11743 [Pleurotus djamor]|nr:hypothetical protein ONZ45_g11743 [Pleurotus djamor]